MPLMKYSEIALAAAFAILASAAWVMQPPLQHAATSAASSLEPMIVVVITGKRMSAQEKRLSDIAG